MSEPFFKLSDCNYIRNPLGDASSYISLDKANRLLQERGTVVYGNKDCRFWDDHEAGLDDDDWKNAAPYREKNVKALLIQIEPLVRDSAEKIIEDLARGLGVTNYYEELIDRARKLKGKEK